MPHAVLLDARTIPDFGPAPLAREGGVIHKVLEVARGPGGWLLKSLILRDGHATRFLTRVDVRDDGLVVRLDDHMEVERSPDVFAHLAHIAKAILVHEPDAHVGKTNLAQLAQGAPSA